MADALVDAWQSGNLSRLQELITSQGLTSDTAAAQYGLNQGDLDYINSLGISFATAPATAPAPAPAPVDPAPAGLLTAPSTAVLSDAQVGQIRDWINTNYGGYAPQGGGSYVNYDPNNPATGFKFDGSYDFGADVPMARDLLGMQQALGISDADFAKVLGTNYTADNIAAYKSTVSPNIIDMNAGVFSKDMAWSKDPTNAPNYAATMGYPWSTPAPAPAGGGGLINAPAPAPVPGVPPAPAPGVTPVGAPSPTTPPVSAGNITLPGASQATTGSVASAPVQAAAPVTATNSSATNATSQGYAANTGEAATWTPDANSTVAGQIRGLIDADSPLMQRAETRGLQQANRRGLLNSSMAVQAGQAALYDAALPIAQQDANTFATAGQSNAANQQQMSLANMGAKNEASAFGAAAANTAAQINAQLQTEVSKSNADRLFQAGIINQEQANNMAQFAASEQNKMLLAKFAADVDVQKFNASESNNLKELGIDSQTKLQLAQIEATYKQLMQSSASSAEVYKTFIAQMATVLASEDMDAGAKQAAIQNLVEALNASLGVLGSISNINLPELDFSNLTNVPAPTAPTATPNPALGGGGAGDYAGGGDGP